MFLTLLVSMWFEVREFYLNTEPQPVFARVQPYNGNNWIKDFFEDGAEIRDFPELTWTLARTPTATEDAESVYLEGHVFFVRASSWPPLCQVRLFARKPGTNQIKLIAHIIDGSIIRSYQKYTFSAWMPADDSSIELMWWRSHKDCKFFSIDTRLVGYVKY